MNLILPCAPGCCDSDPCIIASDNFNRADDTDINDGAPFTWSGTGAGIEISGNTLVIYSGSEERLRADDPNSTESGVVSAVISLDSSGDYGDIWLNGDDVDNCLVARLTCGSPGSLKIISRSGGSETELASSSITVSASTNYTVTLYYSASDLKATATVGATTICDVDVPAVGYYAGLGCNASFAVFDDFEYQRLGDGENGCPVPPACALITTCGASSHPCCAADYPDFFDITIPAGLFTGNHCPCTGVNGVTFTLERNSVTNRSGLLGGSTRWSYFVEAYCSGISVVLFGSTVTEVDLLIAIDLLCVSGPSCQLSAQLTLVGYTSGGSGVATDGINWTGGGSGLPLQDLCNSRTWVLEHSGGVSPADYCTIDATPGDVSIVKH